MNEARLKRLIEDATTPTRSVLEDEFLRDGHTYHRRSFEEDREREADRLRGLLAA